MRAEPELAREALRSFNTPSCADRSSIKIKPALVALDVVEANGKRNKFDKFNSINLTS
jgi:hypothetical protein